MSDRPNTPSATAAANVGSPPAERLMRVAPLDLRQQRFKTSVRGFDKTEVVAFLTEAADDYEHALFPDSFGMSAGGRVGWRFP